MKANAPEKIYLQQYDENTLICLNKWNISEEWSNKPCNEKVATNIEYVRKDAFIEKAENFFTETFDVEDYNDILDVDGSPIFNYCRFIEDFISYIKGE